MSRVHPDRDVQPPGRHHQFTQAAADRSPGQVVLAAAGASLVCQQSWCWLQEGPVTVGNAAPASAGTAALVAAGADVASL